MTKKNEIENLQLEQNELRMKVLAIKSRVPKFLIGLLLLLLLVVYFLESKLYHYFGTGLNFIQFMIGFFIITSLLYISLNLRIIFKNNTKIKKLSIQLYALMKLNKTDTSE